jgi:hypothetical protein
VTGTPGDRRNNRTLAILIIATALCYAVGYPIALVGNSNIGWVLVSIGGLLLVALVAVVIRRIHG